MPNCAVSLAPVLLSRTLTRARILLRADHGEGGPGWSDATITVALDINPSTDLRVRWQLVTKGLAATLTRKRSARLYKRRLDGRQEARRIPLACSMPPDGRGQRSLRLLSDEVVRPKVVEAIWHEILRQTLIKTISNPG